MLDIATFMILLQQVDELQRMYHTSLRFSRALEQRDLAAGHTSRASETVKPDLQRALDQLIPLGYHGELNVKKINGSEDEAGRRFQRPSSLQNDNDVSSNQQLSLHPFPRSSKDQINIMSL